MKDIAISVAIAAAGVIVAGLALYYLRGNTLIDAAHEGFDR